MSGTQIMAAERAGQRSRAKTLATQVSDPVLLPYAQALSFLSGSGAASDLADWLRENRETAIADRVYRQAVRLNTRTVRRGKKRIHSKPNAGEIQACRWWLDNELKLIRPELAVALGATAAQSLLGKIVPVTKLRGTTVKRDDGLRIFITVHPSYLLRIPDEVAKQAERRRFLDDMKKVKKLAGM